MNTTPYTMPSNVTSIEGLLSWGNGVTNNLLGSVFVFTLYTISFLALYKFGYRDAIIGSSFITLITSVMLFALNFVGSGILIVLVLLFAASMMWVIFK